MTTQLPFSNLTAVTPVDGRYADKCVALRDHFSEYALIKRRVIVEVKWLLHLADERAIEQLPPFDASTRGSLEALVDSFTVEQAERVKTIERTTNHDVKAVEYFLKEHFAAADPSLTSRLEFFHFACTSEVLPPAVQRRVPFTGPPCFAENYANRPNHFPLTLNLARPPSVSTPGV
jgi:adenylosuccinate lyase